MRAIGFKIVPVEKNSTITGKLSFISDRNFRVENPYFWWHSSEKLQKKSGLTSGCRKPAKTSY